MIHTERNQELLQLCKELISAKSYSGEEAAVAAVLGDYMRAGGFDEVTVDRYGNVIGVIHGKRPGKTLLFDGHIDTVPARAEEWKHDPFQPVVEDGKLFGRGATDMKGAVAGFTAAAKFFAQDTDRDFCGTLCVAGVVHEECFEGIAAREISRAFRPDYVVIGEASNLNVKIGQRGRAEIVVETFGVPAHSANPEKGVNAVYQMCRAIEKIRAIVPPEHPVLGKGILELTDVKSEPYPGASVVPQYCRATFDRRLLVGETKESVLAPIEAVLRELERQDAQFKAKVSLATGRERCYTGNTIEGERFFPGWLFRQEEPYVQAVVEQLRADGFTPEITQYNFCTNGSHYAGEAGIPTLGIGPSAENIAHTVDEYITVDALSKASECYYSVMKALMK